MNQSIENYAIEVKDLNRTNKTNDFSLKNINIKIPKGSIVGLIGRNGSGKTTTISCILGLLESDSGEIILFGSDEINNIGIKNNIGVVLDEPNYSLSLTANQINNVMKEIYRDWDKNIFNTYLHRFDLPRDKKTREFSFGMKKKLSLAMALSHRPKLLILDEITSGLDPVSRDEILSILLEFIESDDNSVFISSHITTDLEKVADYIIFMDNGEVVLSEEKDVLLYEYGILRCCQEDLEKIDDIDIIAYRQEYERINILVKDAPKMKNKYRDFIINKPNFDEILLILSGEKVEK